MTTFQLGDTLQGFGLHNAGRHYTVTGVSQTTGRIRLEEHLTGRTLWTFEKWYRLVARKEQS